MNTISRDVRHVILSDAAEISRHQPAAEAVSAALVRASINVRTISLEDWKSIVFDAFQATRKVKCAGLECLASGPPAGPDCCAVFRVIP